MKAGCACALATEDGSKGHKGYVTDLLEEYLSRNSGAKNVIFACGPHPMMRKVAELALRYGVPGYVSLEEKMACGLGNCQGCAVKIAGGYKMVCKDGPVFPLDMVEWR
jgi:dihydroorotate dehydrogenase electron transfer subunit